MISRLAHRRQNVFVSLKYSLAVSAGVNGAVCSQAFFQDFQIAGCNRVTGGAGHTGTPLGVCVLGVLQVCWGV
jgi:hypothetical protein